MVDGFVRVGYIYLNGAAQRGTNSEKDCIMNNVDTLIEQALSGEAPQISSGVYLMTGADLNASRDEDDTTDDLIDDHLYIHTNDGHIQAVDRDDISRMTD